MPLTAVRSHIATVRQDYAARKALRRELDAFARTGERIAASGQAASAAQSDLLARIRPIQARIQELNGQIERTRSADRSDYGAVAPWMRPMVVVRGFCARMVLRDLRRQGRLQLRPLYEQLGATVGVGPANGASLHVASGNGSYAAPTNRTSLVYAFDTATRASSSSSGSPSAPGVRLANGAAKESAAFGVALLKQLQSTVFPKAPALAGLAVGWWIARTYTDSRWQSLLHRVGIGDGGTKVVSSDTLQAMSFWLPILAAAICAYLGDRIAHWFRQRYAA